MTIRSLFVMAAACCMAGALAGAAADDTRREAPPAFLVPPYLQLPTPDGMTVMWETNQPLPGRVEYGTTPALGSRIDAAAATALHEVRLLGLQPATMYYYRVLSGPLASPVHTLRTAPVPGTREWRMALYGDSRSNPATHRKVVEQIARAKVDLIVHTGDIVLDGRSHDSWREQFFQPLAPIASSVPWVSTIGNHERDSAHYFSYMALPGNERYFSFDFANAHIVCLDSNAWIEKGRDSKQYEWLADDLRKPRATTWTFVAFHHPLFSAHQNRPINPLRWDWAPLFLDPANRVDAVLAGHDHFYARNYRMGRVAEWPRPGVLFMTSAGGGASLYRTKKRDTIAVEKPAHHFTLFDFDGDRATVTPIDVTGAVIDRFELTKLPTPADQYAAYEVEELRRFLRTALANAAPVRLPDSSPGRIETELIVPTRFQVPVSGRLVWEQVTGWSLPERETAFTLKPGQPLAIPLRAEVRPGSHARTPALDIVFDPGRFNNRTTRLYPWKPAGPDRIEAERLAKAPTVTGRPSESGWPAGPSYSLLGLPPRGGRADRVRLAADEEWVYLAAWLDDPAGKVAVKPAGAGASGSKLVLAGEHLRVVFSDGTKNRTFALSPEHVRYAALAEAEDRDTAWRAAAAKGVGRWTVEMAIPRAALGDPAKLHVNVVHRRREGDAYTDYELCPAYVLGNDPDLIPDWKPSNTRTPTSRLLLP